MGGSLLVCMSTGTACAESESARIKELERKLDQAMQVIDKLSEKVERLETDKKQTAKLDGKPKTGEIRPTETGVTSGGDLSQTVATQNTRIETLQQQVTQLSKASSSRVIPFDWFHGFADVGAGYISSGHPKGFGEGSLDFYMTPKLGGNVRGLAELLFNYSSLGELEVDLERMQIGYAFSDQLTLWAGRFHTPLGYWNTAYHHGQQIQPSLLRPRFLEWEDFGGVMPVHTVGLWGLGSLPLAGGKLTYDLYAGNTPRIVHEDDLGGGALEPNLSGWDNPSLTVGGNIGYLFKGSLDGLKLGVHGFRSEVRSDGRDIARIKAELSMAGGYLYYNNYDWEVVSEIYGFFNRDQLTRTGSQDSWAGFIHIGHAFDRWIPYVRLEKGDFNERDVYFTSLAWGYPYSREAVGLRYDVNPQSALKLEMNYTQTDGNTPLEDFWESRVQYAIRF
jgi:uncharacterized coiled-coil protein SlyX